MNQIEKARLKETEDMVRSLAAELADAKERIEGMRECVRRERVIAEDERRRRLEHFEKWQAAKREVAAANLNVETLMAAVAKLNGKLAEMAQAEVEALTLMMEAKSTIDDRNERIAELEERIESLEYRANPDPEDWHGSSKR